MKAYYITGLNNVSNFLIVWAAIQSGLEANFVFLLSNAILVGSFVSFGVNVSFFAQHQRPVSSGPNTLISTSLFLVVVLLQGEISLDTFLAWTLIWGIEKKEKLRVLVASDQGVNSPNTYIATSILILIIITATCHAPISSEIKKYAFVILYLTPCVLIKREMHTKGANLLARIQSLLSETLPFLSGFLILIIPFWLLDGQSFNDFRLIVSYVSVTSPFLQMAITYRLKSTSKVQSEGTQKIFTVCFSIAGIFCFSFGLQVIGLILCSLASASLHAQNKFSERPLVYSLLSAITPAVLVFGGAILHLQLTASLTSMLKLFLIATLSHIILSWGRRFVF